MSNILREKIARAIFNDDRQWDSFPPLYRKKHLEAADRVLAIPRIKTGLAFCDQFEIESEPLKPRSASPPAG